MRSEFVKRGTVGVELQEHQMIRIATLDLAALSPVEFNAFDEGGAYLPREEIALRLIAPA